MALNLKNLAQELLNRTSIDERAGQIFGNVKNSLTNFFQPKQQSPVPQQISRDQFSQATRNFTPQATNLLANTPIRYAIPSTMDYMPTPMRNSGSLINPNIAGGSYNSFTRSINLSPYVPQSEIPKVVRHESLHGADYNLNRANSNKFDTLPALDTMMNGRALGDSMGFRDKMNAIARMQINDNPNTYDPQDLWMQDKEGYAFTGMGNSLPPKYQQDYKNIYDSKFFKPRKKKK